MTTHQITHDEVAATAGYDVEGPWAVINAPVTQILGRFCTEEHAEAAAAEFGAGCFAYELSDEEIHRLAAITAPAPPPARESEVDEQTSQAVSIEALAPLVCGDAMDLER